MAENNKTTEDNRRDDYVNSRMKQHNRFYKNIYNVLYTINEFIIALLFLIGSVLFYFKALETWAITLFVIASFQFIIKPSIRLVHEIKARKHYGEEYDRQKT